jgi:hypothetical protein
LILNLLKKTTFYTNLPREEKTKQKTFHKLFSIIIQILNTKSGYTKEINDKKKKKKNEGFFIIIITIFFFLFTFIFLIKKRPLIIINKIKIKTTKMKKI